MRWQRQPYNLDVIGGDDVARVPGWADAERGRSGTVSGSAETQFSRAAATVGAGLLAQPLRIRPGFIEAGLHATEQGVGEHERCGGLEFAAEQIGGAGRLEAEGPPVLATGVHLGEFHLAPRLQAQPRAARHDRPTGR